MSPRKMYVEYFGFFAHSPIIGYANVFGSSCWAGGTKFAGKLADDCVTRP